MSKKQRKEEEKTSEIIEQHELEETPCEKQHVEEEVYPKDILAKSQKLAQFGLHRDVIRAILIKDSYTISEAQSAIQKYIDSF